MNHACGIDFGTSNSAVAGSSGVPAVRAAILKALPTAQVVEGDAFGSVATGLALDAERRFGNGRR